jgi:hypothetical protein
LIILIMFGEEYKSWSSSLCSFLQHPVASPSSEFCGVEKISFPWRESNPGPPARIPSLERGYPGSEREVSVFVKKAFVRLTSWILPHSFPVLNVTQWYVEADIQRHLPRKACTNSQSQTVSNTLHVSAPRHQYSKNRHNTLKRLLSRSWLTILRVNVRHVVAIATQKCAITMTNFTSIFIHFIPLCYRTTRQMPSPQRFT